MWLQQDGTTCHASRDTVNLLKEKFEGFIICRNEDINYPSRSCDLIPFRLFFLCVYVKSRCLCHKPRTVPHLMGDVTCIIREIEPQLFEKVIENWVTRIHARKLGSGGHLNDIVFHT